MEANSSVSLVIYVLVVCNSIFILTDLFSQPGGKFPVCDAFVRAHIMLDGNGYFATQVDLDLGNYERFLDVQLTKDNNITTGKIYQVRPLAANS